MRFLALHGSGTNNAVFESQTAAFRYKLGEEHTFEFLEAPHPWRIAPEIKSVYPEDDDYFCYYDPSIRSTIMAATSDLAEYIMQAAEDGEPYDAIIGFSQGASLAATMLAHQFKGMDSDTIPIKCAIFCCGGIHELTDGYTPSISDDESDFDDRDSGFFSKESFSTPSIKIPTMHVIGKRDYQYNGWNWKLVDASEPSERNVYVHDGSHEMPKSRQDLGAVVEMAKKMIDKVNFAS